MLAEGLGVDNSNRGLVQGTFDTMKRFSVLLVVLFGVFFPAWAKNGKIIFSVSTDWGKVVVRQQADLRTLLFVEDGKEAEESRMSIRAPHQPILGYVRQMLAATAVWQGREGKPPLEILVVGLGGASLSNALAHYYPSAKVTSIELEPAVVEAARRHFFYRESDRVVTVIDDARHFLETSAGRYDLIYLDAFAGLEVPAPLRTVEFARLLEGHLRPGGAVVANIHFIPEEPSLRYQRALREVFPHSLLLSSVAQGVGIYSREAVSLNAAPAEAFGLELKTYLRLAPEPSFEGVEPYRDESRSGEEGGLIQLGPDGQFWARTSGRRRNSGDFIAEIVSTHNDEHGAISSPPLAQIPLVS